MPITLLLPPPQIFRLSCEPSRKLQTRGRLVGARGAGGAMAPTDFDKSVNLISTRGGQIMPITLLLAPQIFRLSYDPERKKM